MKSIRRKPNFITIEGIDGVGKSTAVNVMVDYFKELDLNTEVVRQARDTELGALCREYIGSDDAVTASPTTMAFMFCATITDTIERIIEPAHLNGKIVISDRYTLSTRVYQQGSQYIDKLCNVVENELTPDIIFILDAPPRIALERIRKRNESSDALESTDINVLNQRRKGFMKLARINSVNTHVIDASGSPESVAAQIIRVLDKYY